MKPTFLLLLFYIFFSSKTKILNLDEDAVTDDMVEHINSQQSTWTASKNTIFGNMKLREARKYIMNPGERSQPLSDFIEKETQKILSHSSTRKVVPKKPNKATETRRQSSSYNVYDDWPMCNKIPVDQLDCGSCWAQSVVQSCGDRFCIEYERSGSSANFTNLELSAQELVSCYYSRINPAYSYCGGAEHVLAMGYLLDTSYGVVSEKCMKYTMYSSGQAIPCPALTQSVCPNSDYEHYDTDRYHISNVNQITNLPAAINEITNFGPIVSKYVVYQDFYSYSGGIYVRVPGYMSTGFHSVSIVGYGEENSVRYWIVKNSWGEYSGSEEIGGIGGFFRIRRETNECRIEEFMYSCTPVIDCSHFCYGVCHDQLHACSGNGNCNDKDTCSCNPTHHGDKCNHLIVPWATCNSINSSNPTVCSGHGGCEDIDVCNCDREYSGNLCESYKSCGGIDFEMTLTVCSGRGVCQGFNNCSCSSPYFGVNCELSNEYIWVYIFVLIGLCVVFIGLCIIFVVVLIALSPLYCKKLKTEWNKIKKQNAQTMNEIRQNTANMKKPKKEKFSGDGSSLKLSKSEEKAIGRLIKLGFTRHECIQAYFACEKNENNAANFLFETIGGKESNYV